MAEKSEVLKRRGIARRVVDGLVARSDLKASLLTGSVAQGSADEHSDVDLLNYYLVLPPPGEFSSWIEEAGGELIRDLGTPDEDGFLAAYLVDGVQVQTGAQTVGSIDRELERIESGDVDWTRAKLATGLLEGVPLHGAEIIDGWRARAAYPESLRRREVEANLGVFPIWAVDEQLASRDAELFRRQMLVEGAFRLLAVLSAVNGLYFTTFQFKRAGAHIEHMRVKPQRLAERLDRVADGEPSEAAEELRKLTVETRTIVEAEMPGVDTGVTWQPPRAEPPRPEALPR